uniref:Capsid protein n=1 Tax=Soybean yellow mottle mosaic virus TaxID=578361 RepID=A0A0N9FGP7_9TOMB|nr:coat protein [Soybean yellow mottle mosaic virus]
MNGTMLTVAQLAKKEKTEGRRSLSKNQRKRLDAADRRPLKEVSTTARVSTRRVPAAISSNVSNGVPNYAVRQNKPVIQHTELWGTLMSNSSESPAYIARTLNPSDPATFNWVQPLSTGYDMYRLINCEIIYTPRCATTTTGSVVLAHDPDASDANPDNVTDLLNMAGAVSGSVFSPLRIKPNIKQPDRYVRDNTTSDPKLVDAGKILVASYGQQPSTTPFALGEVRFSYTLQLLNPQPHSTMVQRLGAAPPPGVGPSYATLRTVNGATSSTNTITFATAGAYLVTAVDATAGLNTPVVTDFGRFRVQGTSAADSPLLMFGTALKSGATITFEGPNSGVLDVYVVRDSGVNNNAS